MSHSGRVPVPDRKANLLRAMRGLPSKRLSSCYEPAVDRAAIYTLSRRARFWPGSDELAGDEWGYWYGDIDVPSELDQPRSRPSCLQDEARLDQELLKRMGGSVRDLHRQQDQRQRSAGASFEDPWQGLSRRRRGASLSRFESALDSVEGTMDHVENARRLRASSTNRLQAARASIERDAIAIRSSLRPQRDPTPIIGDQGILRKKRACFSITNDIFDETQAFSGLSSIRQQSVNPSYEVLVRRKPFSEIERDYDNMLSRMGVTKELKAVHGRCVRR